MFEEFKKIEGKTIESVKNISTQYQDVFQVNFTDGSIAILKSVSSGYDIGSESIEVEVFTK